MDLTIHRFKPKNMADNRTCMIIGKRNTGKSVLLKDIMYHKRHLPVGMVMSGTEEGNSWFSGWVPDSFIYSGFNKTAVEKLIKRSQRMCKMQRKQNSFLVLDDCMYDKKVMQEVCMRQLFMNGRHWGIFLAVTAQYVMDIPIAIRSNCDYVFVMKENILAVRERLWKMFFGVFRTFEAFNAVMDACTEDYSCLVFDNTTQSNRIEDIVFWYKADLRNNFRMGSPMLWDFHSRNYNPEYDEDDQLPRTRINVRRSGKPRVTSEATTKGSRSKPSLPRP